METTIKKQSKKEILINTFIEKHGAVKEDFLGQTYLTYTKENGVLCAAVFLYLKSQKPNEHFRFDSEEQRTNYINGLKTRRERDYKLEQERLKKYEEEKKAFVPGSILYASWGFEQTNINFYIIVDRKKDFVFIQEVGKNQILKENLDIGTCTPNLSVKVGPIFKKKLSKFASINLESYKYCSLWNGQPMHFSSYA